MFETVPSDPVGEKLEFLKRASAAGYDVVWCFIGLESPDLSDEGLALRVMQGGHDVPSEARRPVPAHDDEPPARHPRATHVLVFDNSDLRRPFRRLAEFRNGAPVEAT